MSKKLKPCPFCGSTKVEVTSFDLSDLETDEELPTEQYAVMCVSCGCGGVNDETEDAAIENWNRRATEASTDRETRPDLKPCPFCGSAKVDYESGEQPDNEIFVICHECGASSPVKETREEAAAIWNRRAGKEI